MFTWNERKIKKVVGIESLSKSLLLIWVVLGYSIKTAFNHFCRRKNMHERTHCEQCWWSGLVISIRHWFGLQNNTFSHVCSIITSTVYSWEYPKYVKLPYVWVIGITIFVFLYITFSTVQSILVHTIWKHNL